MMLEFHNNFTSLSMGLKFQDAFCKRYDCSLDQFENEILRRTLFLRARILYPIAKYIVPNAFFHERRLIQILAQSQNYHEVETEIDFYQHKFVKPSPVRNGLKFRISGKQILRIAKDVW